MTDKEIDIKTAVTQMREEYTHCRDYGHNWRPHYAEKLPGREGFYEQIRCERCGTERGTTAEQAVHADSSAIR